MWLAGSRGELGGIRVDGGGGGGGGGTVWVSHHLGEGTSGRACGMRGAWESIRLWGWMVCKWCARSRRSPICVITLLCALMRAWRSDQYPIVKICVVHHVGS